MAATRSLLRCCSTSRKCVRRLALDADGADSVHGLRQHLVSVPLIGPLADLSVVSGFDLNARQQKLLLNVRVYPMMRAASNARIGRPRLGLAGQRPAPAGMDRLPRLRQRLEVVRAPGPASAGHVQEVHARLLVRRSSIRRRSFDSWQGDKDTRSPPFIQPKLKLQPGCVCGPFVAS